jgi:hypothetical protein
MIPLQPDLRDHHDRTFGSGDTDQNFGSASVLFVVFHQPLSIRRIRDLSDITARLTIETGSGRIVFRFGSESLLSPWTYPCG